jgi:hypothetical protein
MMYALEMASSGMIYLPSFIKIGQAFKSCWGDKHTDTNTDSKVTS